ncbi:MAG: RNA polymerase sigma-70 factor [Gracilimonas sp.]|jgi:RNA polymerase sigma-70 factor (ECF subfamily)|uniref:RNA polymerase sigma factor n=1 Tax=Gracilimonas sp. TaxID=1974203 RepID=UPI003751B996|nr:RNA polymerase sigma-70 factor [Gracilimonas sp.]
MDLALIHLLLILGTSLNSESNKTEIYIKIKNGDQKAFKKFFDSHHAELFRYLRQRGVAKEAAEDLIQKAFIYIWENRDKINEYKSLRAYLFQIAYTRMLNLFRDNEKYDRDQELPDLSSSEFKTDQNLRQQELSHAIESAISAMPEKRQQVFRLCFLQEFTYKDAAQTLEVSVKTVENHMGLALKDLRESLSETAKDFL